MSWLEALILGIIQGFTEFLPISSSGHLELGRALLGVEPGENITFTVVVHGATVLSTIMIFRKDIVELFSGLLKFQWNESTRFSLKIIASMIPVGIVGVFFKSDVEALFTNNVLLVGSMLLITGSLLAFTHYAKKNLNEVTYTTALLIGIAQALAVLPGISRSGSTIAIGLLLGVKKESITRFSFLMVLAPIIGANVLDLYQRDMLSSSSSIGMMPLVVGFIAAFVVGVIACKWMIRIVNKGQLLWFAMYCLIVGIFAIYTAW